MGAGSQASIIDGVCVCVYFKYFYDFMAVDVYNEGPCVWGLVLYCECYCTTEDKTGVYVCALNKTYQ